MTGMWRVVQRLIIVRILMIGASAVIKTKVSASASVYGYPFSTAMAFATAPDGRCSGASMRVETKPTIKGMIAAAPSIARRTQLRSTQAGSGTNASKNVATDGTMMPITVTIQATDPNAMTDR